MLTCRRLLVVWLLPSAACLLDSTPSERAVATGVWGAPRAVLTVAAHGARLELDCAHGEVSGALMLGRDGRFDKLGVYVRERPGPVVQDEPPDSHPARFSGRVDGRSMRLTVTPTDGIAGPGTFTLTLGAPGQLTKCL